MDEQTQAYTTMEADYASDYTAYDYESESEICDRGGVRDFRRSYEPPLFWLIFVLGAIGNLLVVWMYTAARNKRVKTTTDVYLLSLAVADLLFLCTLPFWASDATSGWDFGGGLCRTVSAIYKINFFSSMFLLTCISLDRYVAIVQVTKAQNLKEKRLLCSKLSCVGVWVLSAILALPEFIFAKVKQEPSGPSYCVLVYWYNENNRTKILVLALQICMGFCLPVLVMVFCYSMIVRTLMRARSFEKHKALRVIVAVVLVFVLSQLPHNVMLMVEASQAANATITSCETLKRFDVAGQVVKSLAYTHACLNPILYVFIGERFRRELLKVLKRCTGSKLQPRPSIMSDTETTPAFSI